MGGSASADVTNLAGAADAYFRLGETVFGQAMLSASRTSAPVPVGAFRFDRYGIYYRPDTSARVQLAGEVSAGGFYDGRLLSSVLSARASASPRASLGVSWEANRVSGVDRSATKATHILAPELRLALDPRVQLTAFVQLNTAIRRAAWNVRFSWEFRPLSFVYLVYDDPAPLAGAVSSRRDRRLILKVTLLKAL